MKNIWLNSFSTVILLACFAMSSCVNTSATRATKGFEKRRYTKGYYLALKGKETILMESRTAQITALIAKTKKHELKTSTLPSPVEQTKRQFQNTFNTALLSHVPEQIDSVGCGDVITFRDGKWVKARVISIDINDIIYLRCDNLSGPKYVVPKATIARIDYANGAQDVFNGYKAPAREINDGSYRGSVDGMAVTSLIFGLLALVSLLLVNPLVSIFGLFALLFGIVAMIKIPLSFGEKTGIGLAIAGLIMGLLITVLGALGFLTSVFDLL